jgi:cytoskeletal protein RodZ
MASHQPPQSKVVRTTVGHPFAPNGYPSFPKPDPIVVELPADDLIDAGNTRPIQVASLHNPGRAAPFTPPPPAPVYQEPIVMPPATPAPAIGYGTMPSVAWQGQQQEYPQSQQYVQMAPQAQQYAQHPSFAPTAMDVQSQYPQQQPPKKKSRAGLIIGIVLGVGFLGLLGVGGAGVVYWKYYLEPAAEEALTQASVQNNDTSTTSTSAPAATTPAATTVKTADPTPAKTDPLPVATTTKIAPATTSTWKPPATTTTSRVAAKTAPKADDTKVEAKVEPKTDPKADAKADAPASEGGTGTVRSYTAEAGKPITIDGTMAGVAPAPLTVSCGSHQIQVGTGKTKTINVPCNGAVTVGSPDGT